ncbi:MAG: hypothetical protein K8R77_07325 [Anaerolineaceae bacterium]|nr:hypothetical protein [Anaerolineaceae bacterium]
MNRTRFSLFSLVFLVSAALGLVTASSLSSFFSLPATQKNADAQPEQKNIIIIHVDDLESRDPQLVSVWSLFSVITEQTYITMKPLYPATFPDPALAQLADSLDLNTRKQPSQGFLNILQAYQLEWDGYILVDHQGILEMHQWLVGTPTATLNSQGNPDPDLILQEETLLFNGICRGLNQAGTAPQKSDQWDTIFPGHLKTNVSMSKLIGQWQLLNENQSPLVCNIFSN